MTARPIFSESRRRPVRVAVALCIVMVAVLLAAGCDYVANSDIVVVKLTPNGSMEWSKVIDSGGDDTADFIAPISDGGFVTSVQISDTMHTGRYVDLIKFSSNGEFLWNQSAYELNCGRYDPIENRNSEIITVGGKEVCWFNPRGELILNRSIPPNGWTMVTETGDGAYILTGYYMEMIPYTKEEFLAEGRSISYWTELCGNKTSLENPECAGKHLVFHTQVAKLDQSGNVLWQYSLRRYGFSNSPTSITEIHGGLGYVLLVRNTSYIYHSVRLDYNGTFIDATPIDNLPVITNRTATEKEWKYSAIPYFLSQVIFFDSQGTALGIQNLHNTSMIISRTNDGGYTSAGFSGSTGAMSDYLIGKGTAGGLQVVKLRVDGSLEWKKPVSNVTVNSVKRIIQTSDGGYAILCMNDKGRS